MRLRRRIVRAALLAIMTGGCLGPQLEQSQQQVLQNQQQIEQQQKEIEALKAQGSQSSTPPPGTCDPDVRRTAISKGDDKVASGDFTVAIGYYQDALTACPGDAGAEVALGRAYEASGQRDQAIAQYRLAAAAGSSADADARQQAQQALTRLAAPK